MLDISQHGLTPLKNHIYSTMHIGCRYAKHIRTNIKVKSSRCIHAFIQNATVATNQEDNIFPPLFYLIPINIRLSKRKILDRACIYGIFDEKANSRQNTGNSLIL